MYGDFCSCKKGLQRIVHQSRRKLLLAFLMTHSLSFLGDIRKANNIFVKQFHKLESQNNLKLGLVKTKVFNPGF